MKDEQLNKGYREDLAECPAGAVWWWVMTGL